MNSFDIVPFGAGVSIKAVGSTRAGLLVAAVKGVVTATESHATDLSADESERTFSIKTKGFGALVAAIISELLADSQKFGEAYSDVKFFLITDKEAEGAFIARPGRMDGPLALSADQPIDPVKNPEGMWEADIVLG